MLDIGPEHLAGGGALDGHGSGDTIAANRRNHRRGAPMTERRVIVDPLAFGRAAAQPGHVGLGPGLVDEDQPAAVPLTLDRAPPLTTGFDVGALLLAGVQRFFYRSGSSPAGRSRWPAGCS